MSYYRDWEPYVPVAMRRETATKEAQKLLKKGETLRPISITSRKIAQTFWGIAWCENLESYADWANRMPRGRTYARNGSILDLQIESGSITSLVSGSSLYKIKISIDKIGNKEWKAIRTDCGQQISSLLDLMRGKMPPAVLERLTAPEKGMFPTPKEMKFKCSCPDYASVCKHVAATLYGVGYLLDAEPELFFTMRGVDQAELVSEAFSSTSAGDALGLNQQSELEGEDLAALFGIELASSSGAFEASTQPTSPVHSRKRASSKTAKAAEKKPKPKSTSKKKTSPSKKVTRKKADTIPPAKISASKVKARKKT